MKSKPSISSGSRSRPCEYCSVCDHKVFDLKTHEQTGEHKRHLRHPIQNSWGDEWPTEKGLWWFYGWCFGKEGIREKNEPELYLVKVSGPLGSGDFMYVTNGHFLYKGEGATGKWRKASLPELPNLEEDS